MIRNQTLMISSKIESRTHENRRPTYGKIKVVPPCGRQAIATACLPAGASVDAHAARSQNCNNSNIDFGTRALQLFEKAHK